MNNSAVLRVLDWMKEIEIGSGDLTTENVSLYPVHVQGELVALESGIFSGKEVISALFSPAGERVKLRWNLNEGDLIHGQTVLCQIEGNGAEILKLERLVTWIVGRMSGIATATRSAVQFLEKVGKKLVPGASVSPIFEVIDRIALETGGCVSSKHGLENAIYVTQNHVKYAGGLEKALKHLQSEIGDIRKKIRFDVEVNTVDQFKEAQKLDCDAIHVVGFSSEAIRELFEHTDIVKMPILHLNTILDFQPEFYDYFFRNCAIEALTGNINLIKNLLIIQYEGESK